MNCLVGNGGRKKAVVVVPIYKEKLAGAELASFLHNANVLKNHDVVAVHPEGLNLAFYRSVAPDVEFRAFRKNDFSSVTQYNRLLISPRFYEAFSDYDYLLICHFDAWVFKDDLADWCDKGYDYIGAPFIEPFVGKLSSVIPFLATLCMNKIGNGGFCLRKITTHIAVTKRMRYLSPFCSIINEDILITLFAPFFRKTFIRPDVAEANRFAVDKKARECVGKLGGELPFGCHGWFKRNQDFWSQHIPPEYVTELSKLEGDEKPPVSA